MSRKREYIKLPITKEDINKTMMLHGDHKSIRFLGEYYYEQG